MARTFMFCTNLTIALLAWRGIKCIEKQEVTGGIPLLAAVYSQSFISAATIILFGMIMAGIHQFYAGRRSLIDWMQIILITTHILALIGAAGLFVSVFDQCGHLSIKGADYKEKFTTR